MEFKILPGQNLLDAALEQTGRLDNVFELVTTNAVGLTDNLSAGSTMYNEVSESEFDKKVLKKYGKKDIHPATEDDTLQGIGYDPIPVIIY